MALDADLRAIVAGYLGDDVVLQNADAVRLLGGARQIVFAGLGATCADAVTPATQPAPGEGNFPHAATTETLSATSLMCLRAQIRLTFR